MSPFFSVNKFIIILNYKVFEVLPQTQIVCISQQPDGVYLSQTYIIWTAEFKDGNIKNKYTAIY